MLQSLEKVWINNMGVAKTRLEKIKSHQLGMLFGKLEFGETQSRPLNPENELRVLF